MTAQTIRTMCPMNCHPTLCGMEVTVDQAGGVKIAGDPTHPDSHGALCMRGEAAHQIVGNAKRLLRPLMRADRSAGFEETTWEAALSRIAGAMTAAGRERVGVWAGHGLAANDYGVGVKSQQVRRFADLYGCQTWGGAMVCWGMGGLGFGLTGALDVSTKEDMAAHSDLIVMWGANTASQANTTRHIMAAKKRGAKVVVIDMRRTEASALADEALVIRPGTDAALALALMHVLIAEDRIDRAFIDAHTIGFAALAEHLAGFTPDWAAAETGLAAETITALARRYAAAAAPMIVAGGSSLHKGRNEWRAARAIACLPALVGAYGRPGAGFGPRHGVHSHGRSLGSLAAPRRPGRYIPAQMASIQAALTGGEIDLLLLLGSNLAASYADGGASAAGLDRVGLVVGYDIFMNPALAAHADIILPGTIWLEEVGVKATATHIHLCDTALAPAGEARPIYQILPDLAARLGVEDVSPWASQEAAIDAVLDDPSTGHATVAGMRAGEGRVALNISPVAYPDLKFHTPSGRIEFYSEQAISMGLPPLPEPPAPAEGTAPLTLAHGRTWTHFHSFYDHGRALPALAARNVSPELWMSKPDAAARGVADGDPIRVSNARGGFDAVAKVTAKIEAGAVWMRDGWPGSNRVTSGRAIIPDTALDAFPFTVGQSSYAAEVEVTRREGA